MAALPYMQLYVAEYLADTAHLTAAQHGAYLLLLFNYWQRGKPLVDDNVRLANVARMSNQEWNENRATLEEFFVIEGGLWVQRRVERDLAAVRSKSDRASAAGKASAERRGSAKTAIVELTPSERLTSVEQAFNHTDTDTDTDTEQKKKVLSADAERVYAAYPRKVGKSAAVKAIKRVLKNVPVGLLVERVTAYAKQCERTQREQQFIPHPATWFNQGRWEDEDLVPAKKPVLRILQQETMTDEEMAALPINQWSH